MIECMEFKRVDKGNLVGFADVFISGWGLEVYGLSLHEKNGRRWVNFPSKMYEKDGERKYAPYFRFRDSDKYRLFCEQVKEAIENKEQEIRRENVWIKEGA